VLFIKKVNNSKNNQWYLDTAAAVHVTHAARLFIDDELNLDHTEWIEIASDEAIQTLDTSTIKLDVIQVSDENAYVHLIEIHYCLQLDTNLLSLGALEAKGLRFSVN
jgi:hypothetical protein